ncbi:PREDICTED: putative odorant receptor 71a [Wasmannia auropunctata]|uniref:putative odorant receptor 71a n=1 Tax=Wasmannia auropunctata TaxID=64793 RepID=UPI0005EF167C|nr:PREDICTED: putative odorant receptor 71a [Wasmannia auropunctata]
MQILSFNFLMYTFAGIWRPVEWSSNGAKLLYNIFTSIVLLLEYFLMLSQFMDILLMMDNIDDFVTNSLIFAGVAVVTCKTTLVVIRRDAIINLVQILLTAPCKPRNEDEKMIQTKFDEFIRSWSMKYFLLAMSSLTSVTIRSVLNVIQGELPYRVWVPFDYNIPLVFWIVSIQQTVTMIFATIINVGTETLVFGLFLQTCAQLEIFENRLHKLVTNKTTKYIEHSLASSSASENNNVMISEHIRHHLSIYKYAETVNVIFNEVLFMQFFGSILILCTSVFYMSAHISESGTAPLLVYTICMFVQIYVYCWSGNEVMLKSMSIGDAVYHLDWPSLPISEKKELLMIMIRSTIPIKFTSSFLITISLQSYVNMLKTSYSAFNVLQQS